MAKEHLRPTTRFVNLWSSIGRGPFVYSGHQLRTTETRRRAQSEGAQHSAEPPDKG
jgi:hypothetical protein